MGKILLALCLMSYTLHASDDEESVQSRIIASRDASGTLEKQILDSSYFSTNSSKWNSEERSTLIMTVEEYLKATKDPKKKGESRLEEEARLIAATMKSDEIMRSNVSTYYAEKKKLNTLLVLHAQMQEGPRGGRLPASERESL